MNDTTLDLLGSLTIGASYCILVGVLISAARLRPRARMTMLAAATGWAVLVVTASALGLLSRGVLGPLPGPVLVMVTTTTLLLGTWLGAPSARAALMAVPTRTLVALHVMRVAGAAFLLLQAQGRLSAPFAPSAGWGDILAALLAIPVALIVGNPVRRGRSALIAWNVLGTADLVLAVSLGALSTPGTPLHVFDTPSGNVAVTQLPWLLIPSLFVPIFLLLHLAIAAKLRAERRQTKVATVLTTSAEQVST